MKKNHSLDVGISTVTEMTELLQSLQEKYGDWPIYCCGGDECFLCINEEEQYIILDMEDLFEESEELDEEEWAEFFS